MNRILCYLRGCDCSRRERDRERLRAVAKDLTERIDLGGLDVTYSRHLSEEEGCDRLVLSLCLDWSIARERTAVEEICQALEETAAKLTTAVRRLEGGAA